MSDDEYEFEYSDEEDMEDENDELDIQIENQYYVAKNLSKECSYATALVELQKVVEMEETPGEWGFKALKRKVKMYAMLQQFENMIETYEVLLTYITTTAVTRNQGEKGINSILDTISKTTIVSSTHSSNLADESNGVLSSNWTVLQRFYEVTLAGLKHAENERLWFKTNTKLGYLFFEIGEYGKLTKVIKELSASCVKSEKEVQDEGCTSRESNQILEICALQIQLYTIQKDNAKLAQLYNKALSIQSAIPHPKVVGIIRECGGKMYMMQKDWEKARTDFFEGFKNFDEAGEHRRLTCLKYLVLANMLSESKINVFDSQEAKPYEKDKEIVAMTQLTDAFLHDEIKEFERVLRMNKKAIMEDSFIKHYIDSLLKTIRTKVLVKIIAPYTKISFKYIAQVNKNTMEYVLESSCFYYLGIKWNIDA